MYSIDLRIIFSISLLQLGPPKYLFLATLLNKNTPFKINATLQLSQEGDLIVRDVDGTYVLSTNTTGMSVSSLNLTEEGNLVLFSRNNATVW